MTQQNKLIFAALVGGAIVIVIFLFLLEQFRLYTLPTRVVTQATIEVVVPPDIQAWVDQAAHSFNQQDENFQVQVRPQPLEGANASATLNSSATNLPEVWIAEADFVRKLANAVPYQADGVSVAHDSLTWVVDSRQTALRNDLSWQTIHDTAMTDFQFKLTLPPPGDVVSIAACLSAAASYHQQTILEPSMARSTEFRNWFEELTEAIPNRQLAPHDQLASRPPRATAGLLFNSAWQNLKIANFIAVPPAYPITLNYPYLIRTNWPDLSAEDAQTHQQLATNFRAYLLSSSQQATLNSYGLTPTAPIDAPIQANERVIQGLQWCWQ